MQFARLSDKVPGEVHEFAEKKTKAGPAQQLIDSLLDERTPSRAEDGPAALQIDDRPYDAKAAKTAINQRKPSGPSQPTQSGPAAQSKFSTGPISLVTPTVSAGAPHVGSSGVRTSPQSTFGKKIDPQTVTFDAEDFKGANRIEEHEKTVRVDTRSKKPERLEAEPGGTGAKTAKSGTASEKSTESSSGAQTQRPSESSQGGAGVHPPETSVVDRATITELKTVVQMRDHTSQRLTKASSGQGYASADAQLKQSESLRFAQIRINELEVEIERLRRENENLASAGETLGRRSDELLAKTETLEIQAKEAARIHEEEKKVFRGQVQQKDRENGEMRVRMEEMEGRLESNFKKIRVRERELEHRLEIVRMESSTLISTKDKMILDLKRQIDQLAHENEYGKQKTQELYNQYKDKQETARRVVRALRIALTILEGEDTSSSGKKGE